METTPKTAATAATAAPAVTVKTRQRQSVAVRHLFLFSISVVLISTTLYRFVDTKLYGPSITNADRNQQVLNEFGVTAKVDNITIDTTLYGNIPTTMKTMENADGSQERLDKVNATTIDSEITSLSLQILTYKNRDKLHELLLSITRQRTNFNYEIIIVDNGCLPGLYNDIKQIFTAEGKSELSSFGNENNNNTYLWFTYQNQNQNQQQRQQSTLKYLRLCDNPGYSVGNNKGIGLVNPTSQLVLFLNDDLILRDGYFLQSMVNLFEIQSDTAAGVGCMLLNEKNDTVLEAGSIVWRDGSPVGYGRDRTDINAHDLQYTRPVDYVSGACLMVAISVLHEIHGFDADTYPAYFEDTDMQMKIQHQIKKYIWFQPRAVALHKEGGSFGSESLKLMQDSHIPFKKRWMDYLLDKHLYPAHGPSIAKSSKFQMFRASDLRGRVSTLEKPNVLVLSQQHILSSFDDDAVARRVLENVLVINHELKLRVSLFTLAIPNAFSWLVEPITTSSYDKLNITQAGIEVIEATNTLMLDTLLTDRPFYYNVIIISGGPYLFQLVNETLHRHSLFDHAAIIYDAESIWCHRDKKILNMIKNSYVESTILPPGLEMYRKRYEESPLRFENDWKDELSVLNSVDIVVTVSELEKDVVINSISDDNKDSIVRNSTTENSERVMVISLPVHNTYQSEEYASYHKRNGILFMGSFLRADPVQVQGTTSNSNSTMLHDGDSIWYFLQEIYPKLLTASPSNFIPLTIVGHKIPQFLYDTTEMNPLFSNLITFVNIYESSTPNNSNNNNSVKSTRYYYDRARVVISPQLYSSRMPSKVNEAMAAGVPTVISADTVEHFGSNVQDAMCDGWSSTQAFIHCVLSIHNDPDVWLHYHVKAKEYIQKLRLSTPPIKGLWKKAIDTAMQNKIKMEGASIVLLDHLPPEGPESTACMNLERTYIERYPDVKEHLANGTYKNGLEHFYNTDSSNGYIYDDISEKVYLTNYPDVQVSVASGLFKTGWDHFKQVGQFGSTYIYSPEDEAKYRARETDVENAITAKVFPNAWTHFINHGKAGNRVYGCW